MPWKGDEPNTQGPWPRPSCLLCVFPAYTEFQPRIAEEKNSCSSRTLETLPVGLSLEKQQQSHGGKVGNGGGVLQQWGQWAGFGFTIKITSGSVSAERFWKVGGLSEVSGGAFPCPGPGEWPVAKGLTQQMTYVGRWAQRRLWKPHLWPALKACWSLPRPREGASSEPPLMPPCLLEIVQTPL